MKVILMFPTATSVATIAVSLISALAEFAAAADVDYSRDVRPILADKCFACHGPDEQAREADLRLDLLSQAQHVLVGEGAMESEFVRRITSSGDDQMPPPDISLRLTPHDIAVLQQWIEQGAKYQTHWSFVPPSRGVLPDVANFDWSQNPVDHFVLGALEKTNVVPARLADRERIIRRLTFDLTGLPPTVPEIDAFLMDDSAGAYERLVDRLLASGAFGERMASDWLDVARYSDTYGYQVDRDRRVWPWRDWVVQAFNENMPYDDFVTWQLAGDLLPNATDDQILATTFNRLHPQKVEGGSVPEEFRVEYVADRNHTFGAALMGLTLECARCHDHKFDPLSQREYYQLFAFFNNIDEAGLYSYFTAAVPTPTLQLPTLEQRADLDRLARRVEEQEMELQRAEKLGREAFENWFATMPRAQAAPLVPGIVERVDFEEFVPKSGSGNRSTPGHSGSAVLLSGDDGIALEGGNFTRAQPFSVSLWMQTPDRKERAVVFHRSAAWTDAGSRGYQLLLEDGKLSGSLIHFWPGNALRIRAADPLSVGIWHHVVMTYDGSSRARGLRLFVDGVEAAVDTVRDELTRQITGGGGDHITIGERFRDRGFTGGKVDEFQVFDRQLTRIEVRQLFGGTELRDALATAADDLAERDREDLRQKYLATIDTPLQTARQELQLRRQAYAEFADGLDEIMVMRELEPRRTTHVLQRGAYDAPGEIVKPATPDALNRFDDKWSRDRLGLARWLTHPSHPLTARVAVNRIWQICFGAGLVRTTEDFGSQGEVPTHPELLNWLAVELVESGWDVKRLLRVIVTSATYRQDSFRADQLAQEDPENRLLARGPRYRLPAEMIRDGYLAASGLLVRRLGGPPTKPNEVAVSFKPVEVDEGEGKFRRSLYTYWKRTAPAPVMMTLDAAKRDVCATRRERTKSPLQALVLLNDPQVVEAARVLGQAAAKEGQEVGQILSEMFRLLTSRRPASRELEIAGLLYTELLTAFQEQPDDAYQFLGLELPAETRDSRLAHVAALAGVANTLLNLADCVTKR